MKLISKIQRLNAVLLRSWSAGSCWTASLGSKLFAKAFNYHLGHRKGKGIIAGEGGLVDLPPFLRWTPLLLLVCSPGLKSTFGGGGGGVGGGGSTLKSSLLENTSLEGRATKFGVASPESVSVPLKNANKTVWSGPFLFVRIIFYIQCKRTTLL